jgi:hypothetical protein
MSSLTWLDYSEQQRKQILDVIDQFREQDTRDELGLGSVRDAFADMLFPGTSTIQTRARYFLIVPWIYRALENKRVPASGIAGRARKAELGLIEKIEESEDSEGNIGKIARLALKRIPSSVYWQGLGTWGIRQFRGSQAQYHRAIDRYYTLADTFRERSSEDESDQTPPANWHSGLEEPPDDFPDKCSLKLEPNEARYLADQIRTQCPESLLALLVGSPWRSDPVAFIWLHPNASQLPENIREQLLHARNFSEAMHGPVLLYNLMLAEQEKMKDYVQAYQKALAKWSTLIQSRHTAFEKWDRTRFWQLVSERNPRIGIQTKTFINTFCDICRDSRHSAIAKKEEIRDLIRQRERALKKGLARIGNPQAGKLWSGASGTGQIDFRWFFAQRILRDIFAALDAGENNAQA